jgi:hypothetical protein
VSLERPSFSDDVASVAYWYRDEPHAQFPEFPPRDERLPFLRSGAGDSY